jgi:hypothetical protein
MKKTFCSPPFLLAATGLAALLMPPAALAEPMEFKQVWITGKTYVQSVDIQQRSAVPLGPQMMDQELRITTETSTSVLPAGSGKMLSIRQGRMTLKIQMAGQNLNFDSTKPAEDPLDLGKFFEKLSSAPIQIQLNAKEEPEKLLSPSPLGDLDAHSENPASELFNPNSILDTLRQSSLRTPPSGPVSPGGSWKWSFAQEVPMAGTLNASGNYVFKAMTQKNGVPCAEILMEGTLTNSPAAASSGPKADLLNAMSMKISSGKLAGTLWFDPALGAVREAVIDQDFELTMQNPALPGGKLVIPTHSRIQSTLKAVSDTP